MKCVYDFWYKGKCIINGQGNKSRYNTLVAALESGKMQKGVHNKVFILLLLRNTYGVEGITHNMQDSYSPIEEEKMRHAMWGGNVGNCKPTLDKILDKFHPNFKENHPAAYFVLSSWATHGDACCTTRCDIENMPSEIKDAIIEVMGDIF